MNTKIVTSLTVIATIICLGSSAQAQSSASGNSNNKGYTLSGRSLRGINNRTAGGDFGRFFSITNSASVSRNSSTNYRDISSNNATSNIPPYINQRPVKIDDQLELGRDIQQPLASPNSVIFPIPDQSFDPNSAIKVQVQQGQ
ncbi:hypothetical protein G7B40_005760 [Aetokthonos hydrillicola Thurmond2011]|jgi:hypothetical protein|uniref:Uncharacterized protein n=1 Tax=Aetokthonos hydrillicola Thurmond2011 TaxID=2712845 RepID=A0AAP5I3K2_9CYAN|nr:hypothetical protein [Aetokthonos hydrillicola]MBO3461843.1 hypothetical protein [Aetokthonos hydrillicola CCALA 1050]MBW4588875.1 hypothetical protein [Aetokthonos hydrillicola CCALA 1050]MDR9894076.1 hypothetical protein [Aetokthonos hydrillicola Thurmond2011]